MAAMQITTLHQLKVQTLIKISKRSLFVPYQQKTKNTSTIFDPFLLRNHRCFFESIQDLGSLDRALIFTSQPREFVDPEHAGLPKTMFRTNKCFNKLLQVGGFNPFEKY